MKDFGNALLVAMLRHQRKIGLNKFFEPKEAAEEQGLSYIAGQIRLYVTQFDGLGYSKQAFTMGAGDDGGLACFLNASGIEVAEELEQTTPEFTRSNRYFRLADHEPEINLLRRQVAHLSALVEENRDNDFEDKQGTLAELAALDLLISRPQISVDLVQKILYETVLYLTKRFSDTAIGAAAGSVLTLSAQAFGFASIR